MSYYIMLNSIKTNPDFAKSLIKPDFYVKNILGSYYDHDKTPILKDAQVYKNRLIQRVKPQKHSNIKILKEEDGSDLESIYDFKG